MCNLFPLYRDEWITLFLDKKHLVYDYVPDNWLNL